MRRQSDTLSPKKCKAQSKAGRQEFLGGHTKLSRQIVFQDGATKMDTSKGDTFKKDASSKKFLQIGAIQEKKNGHHHKKIHLTVQSEGSTMLSRAEGFVNLITVMGRLREGKSFLMNSLCGYETFGVSEQARSFTQGAEISPQLLKNSLHDEAPKYALVDLEGQADGKGNTYESFLALPLLLTSKVLIINLKRLSPSKDDLKRVAQLMTASEMLDRKSRRRKGFGHLHFVFRDSKPDKSFESECMSIMMDEEDPDLAETDEEAEMMEERNKIRKKMRTFFSSITCTCLPYPWDDRSGKQTLGHVSKKFSSKVGQLKKVILKQISEPMEFNGAKLSGLAIASIVKSIVENLNANDGNIKAFLSAPSVLKSMYVSIANHVFDEVKQSAEKKIDLTRKDIEDSIKGLKLSELETKTDSIVANSRKIFKECLESRNITNSDIVEHANRSLDEFLADQKEKLVAANKDVVASYRERELKAKSVVQAKFGELKENVARRLRAQVVKNVRSGLPMDQDSLEKTMSEVKEAALRECENQISACKKSLPDIELFGDIFDAALRPLKDTVVVEWGQLVDTISSENATARKLQLAEQKAAEAEKSRRISEMKLCMERDAQDEIKQAIQAIRDDLPMNESELMRKTRTLYGIIDAIEVKDEDMGDINATELEEEVNEVRKDLKRALETKIDDLKYLNADKLDIKKRLEEAERRAEEEANKRRGGGLDISDIGGLIDILRPVPGNTDNFRRRDPYDFESDGDDCNNSGSNYDSEPDYAPSTRSMNWNEFRSAHKGLGWSRDKMSEEYWKQKN